MRVAIIDGKMSPVVTEEDMQRESWFERSTHERTSDPVDVFDRFAPKPKGRIGWAVGIAAVGGAVGGVAMMLTASEIARRSRPDVDVVRTAGRSVPLTMDPFGAGLLLSGVLGALLGTLFGALLRHSLRIRARLLFGVLGATSLWTLVQAFVLRSSASFGTLPFGPMVAGAAVFGFCASVVPPPRTTTN